MFSTFINAFKIKDLRKKILYTILLIVVYRLGSAIPIPGVNLVGWQEATKQKAARLCYSQTFLGRRRYLPGIRSADWGRKSFAERCSLNTPTLTVRRYMAPEWMEEV